MTTSASAIAALNGKCRHYKLRCPACNSEYEDDGTTLECPRSHPPGLLISSYESMRFEVKSNAPGLFRYSNWLPALRAFPEASGTITYRSKKFAQAIGLSDLWIAFNGYWPDKGALLKTATFKELEAYAVLSRRADKDGRVLIVASAGNTGGAFAQVCSAYQIPCLIIIPSSALDTMYFDHRLSEVVRVVIITEGGTYDDAQKLAAEGAKDASFVPEGGVKNIARRDGIGTTLLNAFETIGRVPDAYFQAIGSGTGAIAVTEAANRLIESGSRGSKIPRLILSQNEPFAPIYRSWKKKKRDLVETDPATAEASLKQIIAGVLSNSNPPYSTRGGLYDSLVQSEGDVLAINNGEIRQALAIFQESEGIDIEAPAGVAVASLMQSVRNGLVSSDDCILLHITAGGVKRRSKSMKLYQARPSLEVEKDAVSLPSTWDSIRRLF